MVVNPLYYYQKDNGVELLKELWTEEDGQAECLADQMSADVLGLKSGVTTEGWC